MFAKIVFVLLIAFAVIAMSNAACKDTFKVEHCKVFEPFCSDSRYTDIAAKCAATCKKC